MIDKEKTMIRINIEKIKKLGVEGIYDRNEV